MANDRSGPSGRTAPDDLVGGAIRTEVDSDIELFMPSSIAFTPLHMPLEYSSLADVHDFNLARFAQ